METIQNATGSGTGIWPWINRGMRIHEVLDHSSRYLFHGTMTPRLPMILHLDSLLDNTHDVPSIVRGHRGVSLTRSYEFARTWKSTKRSIVLVLDATRLRTTPVAYWRGRGSTKLDKADEMEEFHIGSIKPLSRFLVSINAPITYAQWVGTIAGYGPPSHETLPDIAAMAQAGFPGAEKLWNRWSPVRGLQAAKSPAGVETDADASQLHPR